MRTCPQCGRQYAKKRKFCSPTCHGLAVRDANTDVRRDRAVRSLKEWPEIEASVAKLRALWRREP